MRLTTITSSALVGDDSGERQIQDYLIAAIQNVRILLAHQNPNRTAAAALRSQSAATTSLRAGFVFEAAANGMHATWLEHLASRRDTKNKSY